MLIVILKMQRGFFFNFAANLQILTKELTVYKTRGGNTVYNVSLCLRDITDIAFVQWPMFVEIEFTKLKPKLDINILLNFLVIS